MYTNGEYADTHFIYGMCRGNAAAAAEQYRQRYPNRRHPDGPVFIRLHNNLSQFGKFTIEHHVGRNRNVEVQDAIMNAVTADPNISTRRIAHQLELSQNVVCCTIHDEGY